MNLQEKFTEVLKRHDELTQLVAEHSQPGSESYPFKTCRARNARRTTWRCWQARSASPK
jgi:hypothetical protein